MNFEKKQIWIDFLLHLKKKNFDVDFIDSLKSVIIKKIDEKVITISYKNKYSLYLFKKFFYNEFIFYINKKKISNKKITFIIEKESKNFDFFYERIRLNSTTIFKNSDPKCNLNNFYFSDKNQRKIINTFLNPNYLINNLLICGKEGLGKTYLANSINNFIINNTKNKTLLFSSNDFFTFVYEVFKKKKFILFDELKKQIIEPFFLIIDNFDFIIDKKQTKLFLCSLLKERIKQKKKNILFIKNNTEIMIRNDLSEYCSLTMELPPYNQKKSRRILKNLVFEKRFMMSKKVVFSKKIIDFILSLQINNIYELINIYKTFVFLITKYKKDNQKIINEFKKKNFHNFIVQKKNKKKNCYEIEYLLKKICVFKKHNYNQLFEKKKDLKSNTVRQIIIFYLREILNLKFKEISFFLKRHHTTIIRNYYNIKNNQKILKMVENEITNIFKKNGENKTIREK